MSTDGTHTRATLAATLGKDQPTRLAHSLILLDGRTVSVLVTRRLSYNILCTS